MRRHTAYNASLGEGLRVDCPVQFCNGAPPTVSWYKVVENIGILINDSSRFNTEWEPSGRLEGKSLLIFKNILISDSGVYRCQSGSAVGHVIYVSVSGKWDLLSYLMPVQAN